MARPPVKIAAAATGAAHLPLAGRRPRGLKYRGERIAGEPVNRRTFILIFAAGLLAGCGKRKKLPALPPGSGVLAFGDSVTWGTGAAPGEDWPSRLATATGYLPHNYDLAVEVVRCRRLVKGYSDTHARGLSKFDRVLAAIALVKDREDAALWAARLREAALKDEEGKALDGAIATIRSFA
jgi:hypothetical protein